MISDRRFIIAGPRSCIFVFDAPQDLKDSHSGELSGTPLTPIWTFQSDLGDFQQGPIFYVRSNPHKPMLWMAERAGLLHRFVFSHGAKPVEEHNMTTIEHIFPALPAVGFSRIFFVGAVSGSVRGCMMTLKGRRDISQGSFEFPLHDDFEVTSNFSFDQESGRVSVLAREPSGQPCVLVFNTVNFA